MRFAASGEVKPDSRRLLVVGLLAMALVGLAPAASQPTQRSFQASSALGPQVDARGQFGTASSSARVHGATAVGSMSPADRAAAVDAYWGEGLPTAEKLRLFDKFVG